MPLPVGSNTYCLRALKWNDAQLLEFAAAQKPDAVFLQDSLDPRAMDPQHWKRVRDHARRLTPHLETGGGGIRPKTPDEHARNVAVMRKHIERASAMGRAAAGLPEKHLETSARMLREVRMQALDSELKIAIEVHKDCQDWESGS